MINFILEQGRRPFAVAKDGAFHASHYGDKENAMEILRKNACLLQGLVYPNGSEVRGKGFHLACQNGDWQDLDEDASATKPSLAYFYH
jgi:hypothetical protein